MVILFSRRNSKLEKEIKEILTAHGGDFITDKSLTLKGGFFTVAVCYKNVNLEINKGIALILDDTLKFIDTKIPQGMIGVCTDQNTNALKILSASKIPVITCGNNPKNTLTISSINENGCVLSLQREISDIFGKLHYPKEIIIPNPENYSTEALMLSAAVLCLLGVKF